MPHTNATCERIFSKMTLLKTDLNKLETKKISGLLRTKQYIAHKSCFDIEIKENLLKRTISNNLCRNSDLKIYEC